MNYNCIRKYLNINHTFNMYQHKLTIYYIYIYIYIYLYSRIPFRQKSHYLTISIIYLKLQFFNLKKICIILKVSQHSYHNIITLFFRLNTYSMLPRIR